MSAYALDRIGAGVGVFHAFACVNTRHTVLGQFAVACFAAIRFVRWTTDRAFYGSAGLTASACADIRIGTAIAIAARGRVIRISTDTAHALDRICADVGILNARMRPVAGRAVGGKLAAAGDTAIRFVGGTADGAFYRRPGLTASA